MKFSLQNKSAKTLRTLFSVLFSFLFLINAINALNILYFNPISNDQCAWRTIDNRKDGYLITDVVPGGVADRAGIKNGDILLKINGRTFSTSTPDEAMSIVNAIPVGEKAIYLIERDGKTFETYVEMRKVFNTILLADLLFALGFAFVGFVVVYTNPQGYVQRSFAYMSLFCLIFFGLSIMNNAGLPMWWNVILAVLAILGRILGPPVFVNFFLNFPVIVSQRTKKRVFIIMLIAAVAAFVLGGVKPINGALPIWLQIVLINFPALTFASGLFILGFNYIKRVEPERKKQLRPILFCYVIGIAGFSYSIYVNFTNPFAIFVNPSLLIPSLLVLVMPLSFGYSIFKFRLMDTHFIIKRSIIYGIITTTIALIYFVLVFGAGTLLRGFFGQSESQALTIVALIIIAFIFDPLKRRVQDWVDRVFYRERYSYHNALLDFGRKLPLQLNVGQIVGSMINTISSTMHIDKIAGVLLGETNGSACFAKNISRELCEYEQYPGGIISILNEKKEPINTSTIVDEKYLYGVSEYEIEKIKRSGVQLIVPMVAKNNLIGFINTGPKLSEKVYSQEDIDLLTTVAGQAAIAIENARLYEKEKTLYKVESEIKLASRIQTEWLPKTSPVIQGFDIAGKSVPAEIVGGDYFDYIEIDKDYTVFVIGDVSGKGLPAALLMANARAILRSQAQTSADTRTCIDLTNVQLYKSSTEDMFVTMFYSLLNSKTRTLYYTNAGHNYPVIFSDGKRRFLKDGGIPLGIDKDWRYKSSREKLKKNDVVLMYTDGITEAFNDAGELYGEERLYNIVEKNLDERSTVIIDRIIEDIRLFKNNAPVSDDMTLIVIKYAG